MKVVEGTLKYSCWCQVIVWSMGCLEESWGTWRNLVVHGVPGGILGYLEDSWGTWRNLLVHGIPEGILLGLAPPEFSIAQMVLKKEGNIVVIPKGPWQGCFEDG